MLRRRSPPLRAAQRGSVLIVALLVSAIISISLASYIKLSINSVTLADRSFYGTSALNLAEMGIEEAMYCYNQLDDVSTPASAWSGTNITWTISGDTVSALIDDIPVGPGVTGRVKVYCSHYNPTGSNPVVVARAQVTPQRGPVLEKWLEVTLRKRSLWANGMVSRNGIVWDGGNSSADSWNSDPDGDGTSTVAYSSSSDAANATVGTPSSTNNAIDISGGTIRGEILSGGGTIGKTSGAILSSTTTGTGWDTSLVTNDFSATFPGITVPSPPVGNKNVVSTSAPITFPSSLPRGSDVDWNGVYYYEFASGWGLTSAGAATNVVTIAGNCVILATNNSGAYTVNLGGNASIQVASGGQLQIFTNGHIEAAGNGMANGNLSPATMKIYGTHTTAAGQTIRFVGNAASTAAVYAPNATFQLKGNGSLSGAVVANSINLNGNAAFHYDEALGNVSSGNPFGIVRWRELQSTSERASYPTVAF